MMQNRPSMRRFVPCTEQNEPELWEDEDHYYQLDNTELCFHASDGPVGKGKLYITTQRVVWISATTSTAFDFDARYIALHAISRDVNSYPQPALYCQLDCENADDGSEDQDDDVEDEMYIVPDNEDDLMQLFDAMSHLALINPDPPEDGEQEGDDELIYNIDEVNLGAEQARVLSHLESVFELPTEVQNGFGGSSNLESDGDEPAGGNQGPSTNSDQPSAS